MADCTTQSQFTGSEMTYYSSYSTHTHKLTHTNSHTQTHTYINSHNHSHVHSHIHSVYSCSRGLYLAHAPDLTLSHCTRRSCLSVCPSVYMYTIPAPQPGVSKVLISDIPSYSHGYLVAVVVPDIRGVQGTVLNVFIHTQVW